MTSEKKVQIAVNGAYGTNPYKTFEIETSYDSLMEQAWAWLSTGKELVYGQHRELGVTEYQLPSQFYFQFFDNIDWARVPQGALLEASPHINIYMNQEKTWALVTEHGIGKPVSFGFREVEDEEFYLPEWPSRYSLQSFSIIGNKIKFPAFQAPWPYPILYPGRYEVWGRLNYLLEAFDENPVTIIVRGPQPYRGLGHQIVKELQDMRQLAEQFADA